MAVTVQLRRGTAAQWSSVNPVLAQGEIGIEVDTHQFKVGDGVTNWNSIGYGGLVGPQGPQGPSGGLGTITVIPPLLYDSMTQTLSLEDPLDNVTLDGANF